MIQIKDLQIFKGYKTKKSTKLSDYSDNMPTFQGFLLEDINIKESKSHASQKVNSKKEEE